MTQRLTYTYTEGTPTIWLNQDSFVYDNDCQDKIVTFIGSGTNYAIASDQVGNITSFMGYTLTWFGGRKLKQHVGNSKTIIYEYNENDIRTSKSVNVVVVVTNFYLNNNNIVAQTTDSNTFYYSYDNVIQLDHNKKAI